MTERSTHSFELRVIARRNNDREGSQLGSLLTVERCRRVLMCRCSSK